MGWNSWALGTVKPYWKGVIKDEMASFCKFFLKLSSMSLPILKNKKKTHFYVLIFYSFEERCRTTHFQWKKIKFIFIFFFPFFSLYSWGTARMKKSCNDSCSKTSEFNCSGGHNKVAGLEHFSETYWTRRATSRNTRVIQ